MPAVLASQRRTDHAPVKRVARFGMIACNDPHPSVRPTGEGGRFLVNPGPWQAPRRELDREQPCHRQ